MNGSFPSSESTYNSGVPTSVDSSTDGAYDVYDWDYTGLSRNNVPFDPQQIQPVAEYQGWLAGSSPGLTMYSDGHTAYQIDGSIGGPAGAYGAPQRNLSFASLPQGYTPIWSDGNSAQDPYMPHMNATSPSQTSKISSNTTFTVQGTEPAPDDGKPADKVHSNESENSSYDLGSDHWFTQNGLSKDNQNVHKAIEAALDLRRDFFDLKVKGNEGKERRVSGKCGRCPKGCLRLLVRTKIMTSKGLQCKNCRNIPKERSKRKDEHRRNMTAGTGKKGQGPT